MNILLTGATGFLGSHILKDIIYKTENNVVVLKRSFSDVSRIKAFLNESRIMFFDVDKSPLKSLFENYDIELIVHCATNYGRAQTSCFDVLETNLMFPIKLLELSVEFGVKTFINTDSYFNKDNISCLYLKNYALSKKCLLLWLKHFSNRINVINMVLEHVFGDDDNKGKFVYQMFDNIVVKRVESLDLTLGEQERDFIYIDDVVNAYIKLIEYSKNNVFSFKSIDVGTGHTVSIRDFVCTIKSLSNSHTVLNFGALPYRENEIMCSKADTSDLIKIGWKPEYTYISAIKKMLKEFNG